MRSLILSTHHFYLFALLCVIIAALLRYALELAYDRVLYFALFYPVVLASTVLGGKGPGVFAMVLSMLVVWFSFMQPKMAFEIPDAATALNLLLFTASASFMIYIADRFRTARAAAEAAEERCQFLIGELEHRSRNSIAVANTIVSSTLTHEPKVAEQIAARLRVVLANDELYRDGGEDAALHTVLLRQLTPYGTDRFSLDGELVTITPKQARNLELVVHELTTNSAKYGAFSVPHGSLIVNWRQEKGQLVIEWFERGRAVNAAGATSSGFGTRLIEVTITAVAGTCERSPRTGGYYCRICFPLLQGKDRKEAV
jgi:two-component sensor histidine kinase